MKETGRSTDRWASLGHALRGLAVFLSQTNARIHVALAVVAVALGAWLHFSPAEWILLTLTIALVLAAEALNTAVELVVDLCQPEWHPLARNAKDVAAAAVLIASMAAATVGVLLFGPHLL